MKTKRKLAEALWRAKAPQSMIDRALLGEYDDNESNSACPIMRLVREARAHGLWDIAERAMIGEFDGITRDAEAWLYLELEGEASHLL